MISRSLDESQKSSNMLSTEVSKCFWNIVKNSIDAQLENFATLQSDFETEWKHKFNDQLEISRDEMFERIRTKTFDIFNELYDVSEFSWLNEIDACVKKSTLEHFILNIFHPACSTSNIEKFKDSHSYDFNTNVNSKLNKALKDEIPKKCIAECQNVLLKSFFDRLGNIEHGENDLMKNIMHKFEKILKTTLQENFVWLNSNENFLVIFYITLMFFYDKL